MKKYILLFFVHLPALYLMHYFAYAQDIPRYARDMPKISQSYVKDMQKNAQDMP